MNTKSERIALVNLFFHMMMKCVSVGYDGSCVEFGRAD